MIDPLDVSPTAVCPWVISLREEQPHLDSVSSVNFFSFSLCVHVCEGSGDEYVCTDTHEGQSSTYMSSTGVVFLFEAGALTALELTDSARLTSQRIPSCFLALG